MTLWWRQRGAMDPGVPHACASMMTLWWRQRGAMDPDRLPTLTNATAVAGCSRAAFERPVERRRLDVVRARGQRMVRLSDLMRSGLVTLAPASSVARPVP